MPALSAHDILRAWEHGARQRPADLALTILAPGYDAESKEALASLSIGRRDSRLLLVRRDTFGQELNGFAACPGCGERTEFSVRVADIIQGDGGRSEAALEMSSGDTRIRFHLPNSIDLAAAMAFDDPAQARMALFASCIELSEVNGAGVTAGELPPELLDELEAKIGESDPYADILFNLRCEGCGREWQVVFDIVSFLWEEVSANAKRLLMEVHTLASAYGWSEEEILSLSPARRQFYLEMIG